MWEAARGLPRRVNESTRAAPAAVRSLIPRLPSDVVDELKVSARRLTSVRRPRDLLTALEAEAGRLSQVVVPVLARHPLPVRSRRTAGLLAATAAGAAAGLVELDEIAVLFTEGAAVPTVPAAGMGLLVAFVAEVWIAVSLRVHQVADGGRELDLDVLTSEVSNAVLAVDTTDARAISGHIATAVGKRMARRWAGALAPGVGIVIDGVAARRTIAAIATAPLNRYPLAARGRTGANVPFIAGHDATLAPGPPSDTSTRR